MKIGDPKMEEKSDDNQVVETESNGVLRRKESSTLGDVLDCACGQYLQCVQRLLVDESKRDQVRAHKQVWCLFLLCAASCL